MEHLASGHRLPGGGAVAAAASCMEMKRAAYASPWDVVLDPDLTGSEKKEILSDWASDARVVEGKPGLRMSVFGAIASWDDIMECLRLVDAEIAALAQCRAAVRPSRLRPSVRLKAPRAA